MTPAEFYNERLEAYRRQWDEHRLYPALFEAVACCKLWSIPLPEWATVPVLNAIKYVYENEPDEQESDGGGYSSHRGRIGMDYAHYLRWVAVKNQLFARQLDALPSSPGRPKKNDPRPTKASILADAVAILRLNQNRLSLSRVEREMESIEASYILVENSRRAGETRFLFENFSTFGNP